MRIFGIDPGSARTGYGCIETDGARHRIVLCGAVAAPPLTGFPLKLLTIHTRLAAVISQCRPDCVAIENLFHASNVRSALTLGHARGVAMLAAVQAGVPVVEYTPAEIKRAIVGYGRAEKPQVQQMIKLILGLPALPAPHDAADALAVAICHAHSQPPRRVSVMIGPGAPPLRTGSAEIPNAGADSSRAGSKRAATSWRHYRPARPARPARP